MTDKQTIPRFRVSLIRVMGAMAIVSIGFLFAKHLSDVFRHAVVLNNWTWWLIVAMACTLFATIGALRSGPEGAVIGTIAAMLTMAGMTFLMALLAAAIG